MLGFTDTVTAIQRHCHRRERQGCCLLDKVISLLLGRPCAIHDEDIDAEFLVYGGDEYWEHPDPEQAFVQRPEAIALVLFRILSGSEQNPSVVFVWSRW
ncbi:hypothetical protein IW262DRAFT_377296 [Armillaria fumosa]|nr:hypothetical protein IW262DRAFT_377296 [Armillaria fumosa]